MQQKTGKNLIGGVVSALFFAVILIFLVLATYRLTGDTNDEGTRATHEAIERAAVLCYATEGFYPPGLSYIEENYGVQIDETRYLVQYDVFASNVRPTINVSKK